MAKSMVIVTDGIVSNRIWCSDYTQETETCKDTKDRPVAIGDSYESGKFYRNGEEVLTPLQAALKQNAEYEAALSEIEAALGVI